VPAENQATYALPPSWSGRFDAVMSHFVIEHVAEPVAFLKAMAGLLKPGGRMLLSFPDVVANPGDLAVVDHLNHFTLTSVREAFRQAGLNIGEIDRTSFPGAFFVAATIGQGSMENSDDEIAASVAAGRVIAGFWEEAGLRVDRAATEHVGRRCAIYGAGFYGSWIANRLAGVIDIVAFIDQNPGLQGRLMQGVAIVGPAALAPEVEVIFVGLNPLKARRIIADVPAFQARPLDYVWLSGKAQA
jgi:SAM-dependent methyltransferase